MEKVKKYRLEQLFENIQINDIQLQQAQEILNKQAKQRLKEIKEFLKSNG